MTKLMVAFRNFANAQKKNEFSAASLTVLGSNSEHHRQHHRKCLIVAMIDFYNTSFLMDFHQLCDAKLRFV